MEQGIREFVDSLSSSGIVSKTELRRAVKSLSADGSPLGVQKLKDWLVSHRKLTKFQAEAVQHGMAGRLVIGEYLLLERIGFGGMGFVYKAKHRRMARIVALKILPDSAIKSSRSIRRFEREVRAAAALEHVNIVTAYDAGECTGAHYLVMQYIDGPDFKAYVDRCGPLSVPQAVDCALQAGRGLAYAHRKGVIHRDIKPSNLLLNSDGIVKILDMGLARIVEDLAEEEDARLTRPGQLLGTVDYMAPEQACDTHQADPRSDVYSLGCTLHYLLTGRPPYEGETLTHVLLAHETAPPPELSLGRTDEAEILVEIFQIMMQKDPAARYRSMDALVSDLELIHTGESVWNAAPRDAEWRIPEKRSDNSRRTAHGAGALTDSRSEIRRATPRGTDQDSLFPGGAELL